MPCGCTTCTCSIVGDGSTTSVTGSGSASDPFVVSASEAAFAASNTDNSIDITPGGTDGHSPTINTIVSPDADNILEKTGSGLKVAATDVGAASRQIGEVVFLAHNDPDAGWLLCDGSSLSAADYPALFAKLGYTHGGAGANFNLPDAQGRALVSQGAHADVDTMGDSDGLANASRTPVHAHTDGTLAGATSSISTSSSGVNDSTETGVGAGDTQAKWDKIADTVNNNTIEATAGTNNATVVDPTAVTVAADGHHHDISHTHNVSISGTTDSSSGSFLVLAAYIFAGV